MLFDRYLFKNLLIATIFTAISLTAVIFLTQSLRFLELVIQSGASGTAFWILTMLALPRFFEVILPISLMAASLFVYHKFLQDSELTVMRATGASPLILARPALLLSAMMVVVLWFMTMWLGPVSLSNMHQMRQVIKAQYSTLLFREGVFNAVSDGLTVYLRERSRNGELKGLMIYDTREDNPAPVTILAKRGIIVADDNKQQVIVYEGTRQSRDQDTGVLNKLNFERYTIDLPDENGAVRQRWREPDERTFLELFKPDPDSKRDAENKREFMVEAHRRLVSPLLAPVFVIMIMCVMLLGPVNRRGQTQQMIGAVTGVIIIQGLYLAAFNMSAQSNVGLILMYILVFVPMISGLLLLSQKGEKLRRRLLFKKEAS